MTRKRVVIVAVVLGIVAGLLLLQDRIGVLLQSWSDSPVVLSLQEIAQAWSDSRLTAAVRTALSLNRGLTPFAVHVETRRGVVHLGGAVAAEDVRAAAERVAAAVPGVQAVRNLLTVDPALARTGDRTLAERVRDRALEGQAQLALALDRDLQGAQIEVQANRGDLTLAGRVDSPAQRRIALEIAGQLPEARSVSDAIHLCAQTSDPILESAERARAAQRALATNPHLSGYGLEVRAVNDRLVVQGAVPSELAKSFAGLVAQDAGGGPVENALQIR